METIHSKFGGSGAHRFWECAGCINLAERRSRNLEIVHSKFGGSGAHRFWECAGCINLAEKARAMKGYDSTPSVYATEGTVAHKLGEICLQSGEEAESYIGEIFEADDTYVTVTPNMAYAVQVYLDNIRETYLSEFGTNKSFLEIEKRFTLKNVDPEAFGTNDACLHIPFHKLVVWDYKHGKGVTVEVQFNKQLLYYALGAIEGKEDIEEVDLRLIQPRKPHKDGKVRGITYPVEKLKLFEIELKEKIKATKDLNAPRKGGNWCKFCDAYKICSEAKKNVWRGKKSNTVANAIEDFK